jgi:hypothetical protein
VQSEIDEVGAIQARDFALAAEAVGRGGNAGVGSLRGGEDLRALGWCGHGGPRGRSFRVCWWDSARER